MSLKAHGVVIAIVLQGAELAHPVDHAAAHRRPFRLAIGFANRILAMAVADAMFGQQIVVVGVGRVIREGRGVARIPIEHEVGLGDGGQCFRCFLAAARVAGHFVFEQKDEIVLGASARCLAQFVVDGRAIGLGIVEPPEIETADAIGREGLAEIDAAL